MLTLAGKMSDWQEQEDMMRDLADPYDAYGVADDAQHFQFGSTPKLATAFGGTTGWFAFEEAIDDWLDITMLPAEQHGPSLEKNRLFGEAATYKAMFDRDRLTDPVHGVACFKDTLRP